MSNSAQVPVLSEDKTHSKFGCSTHPYLASCPGYTSGSGSSPAAEKGNDLHDIAADMLQARIDKVPYEITICIGEELPCGQEYKADDDNKVNAYVEQCLGLIEQYPRCDIIKVEVPQQMASLGLPDSVTTPDFLLVEPFGVCIVMDLKTGQQDVQPTSEQLRSYGLEAFSENGCTSMLCCISQNGTMKTKLYSEQEMVMYQKFMSNVILMAQWENPPLMPGKACTYCKRDCVVRNGAVAEQLGLMQIDPEELSPEEAARFLSFSEVIDSANKQMARVKARAFALLSGDIEVAGWELKPGRPTRVWKNEDEASATILELFQAHEARVPNTDPNAKAKTMKVKAPIDAEELCIVKITMRSPSKIEELVGKSKPVKEALKKHIYSAPSKDLKLTRITKELKG